MVHDFQLIVLHDLQLFIDLKLRNLRSMTKSSVKPNLIYHYTTLRLHITCIISEAHQHYHG